MNAIPPVQQEIRLQPSSSRWLTEEVYQLIDQVRRDEAIYNPRHKYYFCRPYVENFWREMDLLFRKNSGASLAKWTNLRISFRREYANYLEEKTPPCWSYFDRMFFLHPYLRNKKPSEPTKVIDSYLQEAMAQVNNLNYKSQQNLTTNSEASVNEYMDQYISYCEDNPHPSPEELDDIIEEETQPNSNNSILNEVKSESENDTEDKDSAQIREHDEFKDIIIEISDETYSNSNQTELNKVNPQNDCCVNRSLIKRPRTDLNPVTTASNNISLVRPLTLAALHPVEVNTVSSLNANSPNTNWVEQVSPASASAPPIRRTELCDCKTDSDAMFLMSLLPDIRKLNGRDRGKIKIAFQNIVQEFLYPE